MALAKPFRNHEAIGELSEAYIIAKLIEVGCKVLIPYGDNLRYDLVIEDAHENLWRIQCKTGWVENEGAYIEFAAASSYYHTRGKNRAWTKGLSGADRLLRRLLSCPEKCLSCAC